MTKTMDNFWIARGVQRSELAAVKGRRFIYAALFMLTGTAGMLMFGIVSNLVA